MWAMGREGELIEQVTRSFERVHPGVRVDVQQVPWTAAHEKLLTAYVGNATPDICQLGNTWIAEFTALGALEDLGPWLSASDRVAADDFFPGIWETNVVAGRVRGIPWYVDTRLLFYRRDLLRAAGFDHPPATWSEWLRMMRAIEARGRDDHYVILSPTNEWAQPVILGLQQGASLMPGGEAQSYPPRFWPSAPTWQHYVDLFARLHIARYFVNSLVIATSVTLISVLLNTMAGYALAKFRFRGRVLLFRLALTALVVPGQVAMLPLFLMLKQIGAINTYWGVILPGMANLLGIFLVRQFALSIPDSLLDAARIDGASEWRIFWTRPAHTFLRRSTVVALSARSLSPRDRRDADSGRADSLSHGPAVAR